MNISHSWLNKPNHHHHSNKRKSKMSNLGMSKREFACITNRLLARQPLNGPRLYHQDIAKNLGIKPERYYQLRTDNNTCVVSTEEELKVRRAIGESPSRVPMTEPLPSAISNSTKKALIYSTATAVASSLITLLITL